MIIDTSIIIDYLKNHAPALGFISGLAASNSPQSHVVVVGEVLAGARNLAELSVIDTFFSAFMIHGIDTKDGFDALDLMRQFRLSHGVSLPDSLIAATCLRLSLPIATLNQKHFAMIPGLNVVRPY